MAAPISPQDTFKAMKGNIREKTGKSFEAWVALAVRADRKRFKPLSEHMMEKYGLTRGYAQMIAWGVLDPERLEAGNRDIKFVDDLYSGKKEPLRPIYDALIARGLAMGDDVDQVICKTYTSLRSRSQYAVIAPRTLSAVDLELVLPPDTPETDRLRPFKGSNPKFTHRIRISEAVGIDDGVVNALRSALENNRRG